MRFEGSEFGNITIDGKTYEHDVIIRLSGKVKKRQKKLRKDSMEHRTSFRGRRLSSCSRRDAVSSSSARVTKGTCDCLRKPATI